jgi:hypothetical protein
MCTQRIPLTDGGISSKAGDAVEPAESDLDKGPDNAAPASPRKNDRRDGWNTRLRPRRIGENMPVRYAKTSFLNVILDTHVPRFINAFLGLAE